MRAAVEQEMEKQISELRNVVGEERDVRQEIEEEVKMLLQYKI